MGREVRKVPARWEHPKNPEGKYIPLLGGSFSADLAEWHKEKSKWDEGFISDYSGGWKPKDDGMDYPYEDWSGKCPEEEDYMPDWPEDQRTHFQMYEDTSEGTPISPPMETPESLARWLVGNKASAFAGMTATYDQWLSTIKRGFAPSMVMQDNQLESGVAALAKGEKK